MVLREIKKEVDNLANVEKNLRKFQDNWIKPLRTNTNSHLPFVKELDHETRKMINRKMALFQEELAEIKASQAINEKLGYYARYLIELKLTTLQDDYSKSKMITNRMLNDDVLNLSQTIEDVKSFDEKVQKLVTHYNEVNELLQKSLSLEEVVFFMDLPHKMYLQNLLKIAQKQKTLVRDLGKNFISLAKETRKRK